MSSVVHSINVSDGGVPKTPVAEASISELGLSGDRQRNLKYHGGPSRAVSLYSLELIRALQAEGHPVFPGSTGENITLSGVDWRTIRPGIRLRVGEAQLEITSFAEPCKTIRKSFVDNGIARISSHEFPGWSRVYAKVLRGGIVKPGDAVEVLPVEQIPLIEG